MKGVIADAIACMVTEKFGRDTWRKILEEAGFRKFTTFLATQNVEEKDLQRLLETLCRVLGIDKQQAADAFGEYWVSCYAQRVYPAHFLGCRDARSFILKLDSIHAKATEELEGARPPRFSYRWEGKNELVIEYRSPRGMIDFAVGLLKGVGKHFGEELKVTKVSEGALRVVFGPSSEIGSRREVGAGATGRA